MTPFTIVTASLSLLLLAAFITISIRKFGIQKSYSTYAHLWDDAVPIHNANLWSIVTVVAALLLIPGLLERSEGSPLQFLGFLAPLYLVAAAMTPRYLEDRSQFLWHTIFTSVCAVGFLAFCLFGMHDWFIPAIFICVFEAVAIVTKTQMTAFILWAECAMFASAYAVIYFG